MIRLYRILPFLILLAVVVLIAYLIMSFRYTSEKAKATLIKFLTWLFGILSVLLGLITLYAVFEHNGAVIELFGSCVAITVIGLVVTRICSAIFRKNHPHYGETVSKATIVNESISSRFGAAFRKAFSEALRDTFRKQ